LCWRTNPGQKIQGGPAPSVQWLATEVVSGVFLPRGAHLPDAHLSGANRPWWDYASSDLLHMAAGGEMASSGYDEGDVPNAPIAPGGGNAWHMGCHVAYMAIMAALVYRTVAGEGQYIDASIHDQHTWEHDR
jgi:CoA-transferase family III